MGRIPVANAAEDQRFGLLVRNRNQVGAPFELDVFVAVHVVLQHTTGFSGNFYGKIQIFHYLVWVLDVVCEAIRSRTLINPSSLDRTINEGSVLILSKSENPSS